MTKSLSTKISAVIWASLNILAILYLLALPPHIETNIYSLLSDTSRNILLNIDSELELSKELISLESKKIYVLIEGDSDQNINKLEQDIKDRLGKIKEITFQDTSKIKSNKELIKELSQYKELLLDEKQISELQIIKPEEIVSNIKNKLYSAESPLYLKFLQHDPLLFLADKFYETQKHYPSSNKNYVNLFKILKFDINLELNDKEKSVLHDKISNFINELKVSIPENTSITWSSFLRFQNSSAKIIKSEIEQLSFIASILIFTIIVLAFKSPFPFVLSSLSLLSGFIFAVLFTQIIYSQIHLLTIGFGSSLMGACVDYSIHYISEFYFSSTAVNHKEKIKHVIKPITIGAITSVVSFIFLYFGNFSGLSEIAIFSIFGLTASFFTVLTIFPLFLKDTQKEGSKKVVLIANFLFNLPKIIFKNQRSKIITSLLIILLLISGFKNATFNDDIRLLQTPLPELILNQKKIEELSGEKTPKAYILSSGNNENQALDEAYNVKIFLEKTLLNDSTLEFISLSDFFPPESIQQKSMLFYKNYINKHESFLKLELIKEGFKDETLRSLYSTKEPTEFINLKTYRAKELSTLQKQLVLNTKNSTYLVTPIFNYSNSDFIQKMPKGNTFLEIKKEIENAFSKYRSKSIQMTILAYILILLFMIKLYGLKDGALLFFPSLLTASTTLSCLSILNIPINFFSILALIIVLGLCIDYSVFYKEEQSDATKVSVLLSTSTTLCTFGILAFSSTPVLQSFGIVISIGVLMSQFFSAALSKN